MAAPRDLIASYADAQGRIQEILDRLNADPDLARAAAANPLLALEEAGFEISAEARLNIEDRIRFRPAKVERLQALRATIFQRIGRSFDLQSDDELRKVLREVMLVEGYDQTAGQKQGAASSRASELPSRLGLSPQVKWGPALADPLETLQHPHPVMEPLLEYRKLEASEPRLADRALYEEVRRGRRRTPITAIRGVLKSRR